MAGREPPMSNKADYDLPEGAKPLKTWSFLSHKKRRPSEYEVVSTHLFSTRDHPGRPWAFGKNQPLNVWYRENLQETPLQHDSWEDFRDPDEITYRAYNIIQDGQEAYVDGLLEHYAKGRTRAFRILAIGGKASQKSDLEYLSRLNLN